VKRGRPLPGVCNVPAPAHCPSTHCQRRRPHTRTATARPRLQPQQLHSPSICLPSAAPASRPQTDSSGFRLSATSRLRNATLGVLTLGNIDMRIPAATERYTVRCGAGLEGKKERKIYARLQACVKEALS
jgi:hypothetical protein